MKLGCRLNYRYFYSKRYLTPFSMEETIDFYDKLKYFKSQIKKVNTSNFLSETNGACFLP